MNAITRVKFFTLVSFLVVGGLNLALAAAVSAEETKEACIERVYSETLTCDSITDHQQAEACERRIRIQATAHPSCASKPTISELKESKAECKQSLKEYDKAAEKVNDECGRLGREAGNTEDINNAQCRQMAKNCKKGLDAFGTEEKDSDSAAMALVNVAGIFAQMQNAQAGGKPAALSSCVIQDDKEGVSEEERITDKVATLREEIAELKEDANDADKDFNEKQQDVEKEMLEIEKAAEKEKFAKLTENQKQAGQMQKNIMNSEKKRKNNLKQIADKQMLIANLSFDQQELNLTLSDAGVSIVCKKKAADELKAKTSSTLNPKTGKTTKPKFSMRGSAELKKDIKFLEAQCLQGAALERQKKAKAIIDHKRRLESDVATLESDNADEAKAIENEIKQMEELKKISSEEESKMIEAQAKELNSLNKMVTDMEKYTIDKKLSYGEKARAKEDQINKLLLDKQNVKAKFKTVSSAAEAGGAAAANFLSECCMNTEDQSKNHVQCARIIGNDSDMVKGAKPHKAASKAKK